jgi:hypothetical protein
MRREGISRLFIAGALDDRHHPVVAAEPTLVAQKVPFRESLTCFPAPLEPLKLPPHLLTPPPGFIPVDDRFKGIR